MIPNTIQEKLLRGDTTIDMTDSRPLTDRMLTFPLRRYVERKIKAPLRLAIIKAASLMTWKFGAIETAKIRQPNAHCLIKHKEKFLRYECMNESGNALFEAAFNILITEVEHDIYYRDRFNVELEWIIEDILSGKWIPSEEGYPHQYWKEPAPYGGKYSIISKLQKHREEILKIIREE